MLFTGAMALKISKRPVSPTAGSRSPT